jgi:hypothetical protein
VLRIELEITGVKAPNLDGSSVRGTIGLPEMNVLYRNYSNVVRFTASGIHDTCWLEGSGVTLTAMDSKEGFIARVTGREKTASIAIKTLDSGDTNTLETHVFRVVNLPLPDVYLGTIDLSVLDICPENTFLSMTGLFAKYSPEIPLKAVFDVKETMLCIAGKTYINKGKWLSDEVKHAYEEAETGAEFVIESVEIDGPSGKHTIAGPFSRIKLSARGTKYKEATDSYVKCTG